VAAEWESIRHSVGCYKIEERGIQLFSQIEGDVFTIQGLPMVPLLNYLALRGIIAS
jgi:septum formation protein